MNTSDLTYLLNNPIAINEMQTMALEQLIQQYPYFQCVRALHLKGLYNQESFRYNYELKKTAALTTDRSVLFDFITSSQFTTIHKKNIEHQKEIINNLNVTDSQILQVNQEKAGQEINLNLEQSLLTVFEETIFEHKENETSINNLDSGKPFSFETNETHSFNEWLKMTHFEPIQRDGNTNFENESSEKLKKEELINKFIETNPKIPAIKQTVGMPANLLNKTEETSHLMTETLARIYLEQKKYHRAIQAYEILILKYPEKSSFFADRIKNIKEIQNNNQ